MAGTFPPNVNPILLDYTEYLCEKANLHEQTIYEFLEQYVREPGAVQKGVFMNQTGVEGATTGHGLADQISAPKRAPSKQSRSPRGSRAKPTRKRRNQGSGPQDSDGGLEDDSDGDTIMLMREESGSAQRVENEVDEDLEQGTDSPRDFDITNESNAPRTLRPRRTSSNKQARASEQTLSDSEEEDSNESRSHTADDDGNEDPPAADHRVPTFAPAPSVRHGSEATRTHFNLLCTRKKIRAGDQMHIPQSPTHHADGSHTALNGVYAVMQYVSQGPTASVSSWLAYCPTLRISSAPIVGKGPAVFKHQLEQLGFFGPTIRKWSNTVRVFRGGVDLGTVTEVKDRFLV